MASAGTPPSPPFLRQTAGYLYEMYGDRLRDVAVILPNRRGGLFLRKYLSEFFSGPVWSPSVFSIEDFLSAVSGLREAGQIQCLVDLYMAHREVKGEHAQSFDEFLNWGFQLLTDFNEMDRYLADPEKLFTYLDEVRALTVWNPGREPLTEFQQNYLNFYHSLLPCYHRFRSRLLAGNRGYQGMILRHACEQLTAGNAEIPWPYLVFAGFNALTTAEEQIIDRLVSEGRAELLWDADAYYMDDPAQEAGSFLRQWVRKWPESASRWKAHDLATHSLEVHVVGVPDVIGQVKYTGELLRDLASDQIPDEHTAIVLPDERMFGPFLNSIPDLNDATGGSFPGMNITMGLPLIQTPLSGFLDAIFRLHLSARKGPSGNGRYHYQEIIAVLRHPYLPRLTAPVQHGNRVVWRDLADRIHSSGRIFFSAEDLVRLNDGLSHADPRILNLVFSPWESLEIAVSRLQKIVGTLAEAIRYERQEREITSPPEADDTESTMLPVEMEYAWAFTRMLHQLHGVLSDAAGFLTWDSLYKFFLNLLEVTTLPFSGEPLRGLQVMGMLETRTLDFDNLIILTCNEGILPSGRSVQSFIPYEVKREFRLPSYAQKDAIYAYHFYRLLQRAKRVWLLYNTQPDNLGGGEPSRFIMQLRDELGKSNPDFVLREILLNTPAVKPTGCTDIVIPKAGPVLGKLIEKAADGLSPTSLNAYRSCQLRFYFSVIAGLKEPEETTGEIDAQTLGKAVHDALKSLYLPFIEQIMTPEKVEAMASRVDDAVENAIGKFFRGEGVKFGKNLLLVQVARILIRKFLRAEMNSLANLSEPGVTLTVTMLESPFNKYICVGKGKVAIKVKIKGVVDRVDRIGSLIRIVDYKTGKFAPGEVRIGSWEDLTGTTGAAMGFQLLIYAWLFTEAHGAKELQAGIFPLQKQNIGFQAVSVPGEDPEKLSKFLSRPILGHVESVLGELVEEIFDREKPFKQTHDPERCTFCPYISICGR